MDLLKRIFQIIVIAGTGFLVLQGYRVWLADSNRFQIRKIEIRGNDFISDQEICELAGIAGEDNVWEIDLVSAEKHIRRNRLVEDVFIHRELPDILKIQVQEKQALALLKVDDHLFAIDPAGCILPSKPGKMYNMPVLSGQFTGPVRIGSDIHVTPVEEGLEFINQVVQDRPVMYNEISEVVVSPDATIRLHLSHDGIPVFIGHSDYLLKIRSLDALIHESHPTFSVNRVRYIDLRYNGQVILGMRT